MSRSADHILTAFCALNESSQNRYILFVRRCTRIHKEHILHYGKDILGYDCIMGILDHVPLRLINIDDLLDLVVDLASFTLDHRTRIHLITKNPVDRRRRPLIRSPRSETAVVVHSANTFILQRCRYIILIQFLDDMSRTIPIHLQIEDKLHYTRCGLVYY